MLRILLVVVDKTTLHSVRKTTNNITKQNSARDMHNKTTTTSQQTTLQTSQQIKSTRQQQQANKQHYKQNTSAQDIYGKKTNKRELLSQIQTTPTKTMLLESTKKLPKKFKKYPIIQRHERTTVVIVRR